MLFNYTFCKPMEFPSINGLFAQSLRQFAGSLVCLCVPARRQVRRTRCTPPHNNLTLWFYK